MSILHGLQDIKWPALEISIYLAIVHLSPVTLRFRQVSGVLFSAWIRNELCLRSTVSVGVYVFTTLQSSFFVIVLPRMVPATCFFAVVAKIGGRASQCKAPVTVASWIVEQEATHPGFGPLCAWK